MGEEDHYFQRTEGRCWNAGVTHIFIQVITIIQVLIYIYKKHHGIMSLYLSLG